MSNDAHDELNRVMAERMAKLARDTRVEVVFNINTAIATKVAINEQLKLYQDTVGDDFSDHLRQALVCLQDALDNC